MPDSEAGGRRLPSALARNSTYHQSRAPLRSPISHAPLGQVVNSAGSERVCPRGHLQLGSKEVAIVVSIGFFSMPALHRRAPVLAMTPPGPRQIQCLGRRAGRRIVQGAGVVWAGDNAPSGQGGSARWGGQLSSCAGGWQLHGARQAWRGPGRPAGQRVGGAGGSAEEQGDGLVRVQAQLRHAPFDIRRFQQP